MLDVFFTVDVEVWCDSWQKLEQQFPSAFRQYVYGHTVRGDYGLPYMLDVLKDHGLTGVFFVEPLFSTRFGSEPLVEIIGLIRESAQDVELHLHTEWVDESIKPLLDNIHSKRKHLRYFSLEEQTTLIAAGAELFKQAGGGEIAAFRAGNFGFNRDTLRALSAVGIPFDSSYNASQFGEDSGVMPGITIVEPIICEGVYEYPMTVFNDGTASLRHAQLGACSYKELEGLLWQALEAGRSSFIILSHNFELLNRAKDRPDDVVVKRFRKLCSLLDRNRDSFRVRQFRGFVPQVTQQHPLPLTSPIWRTGARMLEQTYRRRYR
jgi:peptidoglycan/xylan/chitin deacetylase (PgdA/CDA1 family)